MLLYNYRVGNLEFLWEVSTMYITIKTITDGVEAYNIIKDSELEALFKCCPKAVVRTWTKQDDCDFIIMDGKLLCAYHMKGTTLLPCLNDKVSLFFNCYGYGLSCCDCPFSSGGRGCGCHKSTIEAKVKYLKDHPDFLKFCIDSRQGIWEEIKGLFYGGARMT